MSFMDKERFLAQQQVNELHRKAERKQPIKHMTYAELQEAHKNCEDAHASLMSYMSTVQDSPGMGHRRSMAAMLQFNKERKDLIATEIQHRIDRAKT